MAKQNKPTGSTPEEKTVEPVEKSQEPISIFDLVQEFYDALANHPDAKVLHADFQKRPGPQVMFQDSSREAQRDVSLRFLMRWPYKG